MSNIEWLEKLKTVEFAQRAGILSEVSEEEGRRLAAYWPLWAREQQMPPPGDWRLWMVMAGRGFGKTRAGAEWVRQIALGNPDARIALVAGSIHEARSVMVEGESGLLAVHTDATRPRFEPSLRRLLWEDGAQAILYSAAEPESLRGPQHSHARGAGSERIHRNEALARLDGLLHAAVAGEANVPPAAPNDGESWIVGPQPSADWVDHAGDIAFAQAENWLFAEPVIGMTIFDASAGCIARYDGSWHRPTAIAAPSDGATEDTEARAAIAELITALVGAGILPPA